MGVGRRATEDPFSDNRTMAYRTEVEYDGETYWMDISNDLREAAVNRAMSEGEDLREALSELLSSEIVSVEEK